MSILKYKYKAHRFINYAFYVVVFLIGVGIGFSAKKIDFNKLISQVLMIDSVSAYSQSISINSSYQITANNYYNEEFLYNFFNYYANEAGNLNLSFTDYNYVYSLYQKTTSSIVLYCPNPKEITRTSEYYFTDLSGCIAFVSSSSNVKITDYGSGGWSKSSYYLAATEDYSSVYGTKFKKLLDFSDYTLKLEFNENLFKDNPDFKEVCVNNYDTFSITSNKIQDYDENNSPMYHSFDFMWFPNGMKGISTWGYDSEEHDHVYLFEKNNNTFSGWWYWLNTKEEIDLYFGRDNPGLYLDTKGYKNKYDYYNWTLYPFEMTFTETYHRYQAFWFKDPYIEYLDGTIKDDSEKYCFYIKTEYDVNILNKNQNGDFNSNITILGGINKDDVTYENELNNNSNGFFSNINNFISKIKPTVNFINTHILELYTSMPLIVRSFIISFLVLIVIRIVIGMVIR